MTGRRISGGKRPEIAASRCANSSRRPRLPRGLVSWSRACAAWTPAVPTGGAIQSRSLRRVATQIPRRYSVFNDGRNPGHHVADAVDRGGDVLIHLAQDVTEVETGLGRRMHAGADLVGDDDQRDAAKRDEAGEAVSRVDDDRRLLTAQVEVGDPERETVEDDDVVTGGHAFERPHDVVGFLHGGPAVRPLGLMTLDARAHVRVEGLRRCQERAAKVGGKARRQSQRLAALATADAAQDEIGTMHTAHPGLPAKSGSRDSARAGLLALGSPYFPRLPGP